VTPRTEILWRIKVIYFIILFFGLFIFVKIFRLYFTIDETVITNASKSVTRVVSIPPNRGDICACDGRVLATSVPYYEVGIDPNSNGIEKEVFDKEIDSLCICLANLLPVKTREQYFNEITHSRDNGNRYYRINGKVTYDQLKAIKTFPILRYGKIEGGLIINEYTERELPFGMLAKRTIGKVDSDKRKGVGLEMAYENDLRGVEGKTVKRKIAGNQWMPIRDANEVAPKDGYDLITTIDINIQDVTETALERKLRYHNAHHGCAIVMEVSTGKIRAMANLTRDENGNYYESFNYAIGEARDPGSTFKLASMIVALEDGCVSPTDTIDTEDGTHNFHGKEMKDSHEGGYGKITIQEAFELSSNVGISKMIYENFYHRKSDFVDKLYEMRLNQPLGVEISGEAIPTIRRPEQGWSKISLTQMSIGYELLMTPLQMLTFYNAVANDGKMVKPRFAECLTYRGHIVKNFQTEVLVEKICSDKTLQAVQDMLAGVVLRGTAKNLINDNYSIAGKTGTAQTDYGKPGGPLQYQASFVGYFPAENPKYSCIVVINQPDISTGYYANSVAGPVFKEIADRIHAMDTIFSVKNDMKYDTIIPMAKSGYKSEIQKVYFLLGFDKKQSVVTKGEWAKPFVENRAVKYYPRNYTNKNLVPDVRGMGLRDAMMVLEEFGLKVVVEGRGKVIQQEPQPNQSFIKGQQIKIILG